MDEKLEQALQEIDNAFFNGNLLLLDADALIRVRDHVETWCRELDAIEEDIEAVVNGVIADAIDEADDDLAEQEFHRQEIEDCSRGACAIEEDELCAEKRHNTTGEPANFLDECNYGIQTGV